jgi:NAD-dependent DNA ligase
MGWFSDIQKAVSGADKPTTNRDGQPLNQAFRSAAIVDRQIDELIGIVKGVMADGMVHQGEVEFLISWLETNRSALDKWPAKAIYPRLKAALADGNMDLDEEREILDLLLSTVGGNTAPMKGESSNSTALPYTLPQSLLTFDARLFCFTGKFQSGSRQWCESQVIAKGGLATGSITKKLHYLVIGEIGSRDWMHSTHGRKIEKAIEYNEAGHSIAILSEQHWFEQLVPKTASALAS